MKRAIALLSLLRLQDQSRSVVTSALQGREKVLAKTVVVAGFLLAVALAEASMTVTPGLTVRNRCDKNIIVAVYYKDSSGDWTTTSFTSIRAAGEQERVASSDNSIFYYYAESTTGSPSRWSGDRQTNVRGKTYPMKRTKLTLDQDRNRYVLELSCKS